MKNVAPEWELQCNVIGFTMWISQTVYFTSEHIRLFTFSVFTLFSCRFRAVD